MRYPDIMNGTSAFTAPYAATGLASDPAVRTQPGWPAPTNAARASTTRTAFTGYDLIVLATLIAQTWALIRVPFLPIAISSALSIALVVVAPKYFLNSLSLVVRVPFLAVLMIVVGTLTALQGVLRGVSPGGDVVSESLCGTCACGRTGRTC